MKIAKSQLRRIIKEELNYGKKQSLANFLFEAEEREEEGREEIKYSGDAGKDLETAFNAGPGAVRNFMDNHKDQAVADILTRAAEKYDGSAEDDMITIGGPSSVAVRDLGPTQGFIDLMKSVAFPLGSAESLDKAISSKTTGAPGSISISGVSILDGHHRWSGVYAITPDGTISTKDFGFPGGVKQQLAAAQMAVAAIKKGKGQPSEGGAAATDIMGKKGPAIFAMIDANKGKVTTGKRPPPPLLNDKMIQSIASGAYPGINAWAEIPEDAEFVSLSNSEANFANDPIRKAIAEKVAGNLDSLPGQLGGGPKAREDMPQLNHQEIGGDAGLAAIIQKLPSGELNVVPPFKKESAKTDGDMIVERWQQLAGLLKG